MSLVFLWDLTACTAVRQAFVVFPTLPTHWNAGVDASSCPLLHVLGRFLVGWNWLIVPTPFLFPNDCATAGFWKKRVETFRVHPVRVFMVRPHFPWRVDLFLSGAFSVWPLFLFMLEASQLNPWIAWISCSLLAVALLVLTKGGKIPAMVN